MGGRLLERDAELAALASLLGRAASGSGSLGLVAGEAGIGKSALVAQLPAILPPAGRLLIGHCDDLGTPRVLGPLRDLVGLVGHDLAEALRAGDRERVLELALAELAAGPGPTVLVLEDLHWADEATLDVVRHLVRRIGALPAVVVLTYRDDELDARHPLRHVLGQASRSAGTVRLRLARLSPAAVRELSAPAGLDPDRVFGVTGGNPYFVGELLASGDLEGVPLTIADAVTGRMAGLRSEAADAVERLAVVPSSVESRLVQALVPGGFAALAQAEERGIVTVSPDAVAFRHELTRRAVVDAMPVARRILANRRVLEVLLQQPVVDLSRVVHHAHEAGEGEIVVEYGPLAAREASAAGAHRQARSHCQLVLERKPLLPRAEEAELWQRLAVEGYTIDAPSAEVIAAQRTAVALRRDGDPRELGDALRWLSRICWWAGDSAGAESSASEAVAVLAVLAHGEDRGLYARALSNRAQLYALAGRDAEAEDAATRGLALDPDAATRSHLLNNLGLARARTGDPHAMTLIEESLRLALQVGDPEEACRAYTNLAWNELDAFDLDLAERHLVAGIALAASVEHLMFSRYLQLARARLDLARGRWDTVAEDAASALEGAPAIRCAALTVVGRLHARRGLPDAAELLREAWDLAQQVGETQRIGPAAAAIAETATLTGASEHVRAQVQEAARRTARFGTPAVRAELAFWAGQVGLSATDTGIDLTGNTHPYALLAQGDWRAAHDCWTRTGCRYEAAVAAVTGADPEALLTAAGALAELGAAPLGRRVRAALRRSGVTRVPRGPGRDTRTNPAGLTPRQLDVARLVAAGLSNAEIATHLVTSVRTVDSHVAAVLAKLGARTRKDVAARAEQLGVRDVPRRPS